VVERNEHVVRPFAEAEPEIRRKIQEERNRERRAEYQAHLRKKIPVWNLFKEAGTEFETGRLTEPANLPDDNAGSTAAGQNPSNQPQRLPQQWVLPELFRPDEPSE
ncbi:MAG TPA: hypothetical protein VGG30_12195, partial [Pirellulales bacterium]